VTSQIKPPFTQETAIEKVQRAEDLWNGKNPQQVAMAYTEDSTWRNRTEFVKGRDEIAQLLARKWDRELDYRLKKDLFSFSDNRIAVHFQYEYRNASGQWFRAYGNEHWEFDEDGLMKNRDASINELPISEQQRVLD
jgi:nuclear transport factor 2 (NTF2) superfamily protein